MGLQRGNSHIVIYLLVDMSYLPSLKILLEMVHFHSFCQYLANVSHMHS